MIKKVLIANRGEIACRVIRTCREMGIATVAVYSEADANALHVQFADESVPIGPPEPAASYLRIDAILDAARLTGADAIHPGYGFLSEREAFSLACREAGITFIGPSPESMRQLGSKIDAKQLAVANDVPISPGFFRPGASDEDLKTAASEIGYPVLLKASAGGGGRGMRVVRYEAEFDQEIRRAREEAIRGFGDGEMMVEKLIERPRHIEVQVLADAHGQVACLFERECSLQRRHQKVVEEAPSPVMTDVLWQRMMTASQRLIRAAGYVGAATVEFMTDAAAENFYFLEVNARLQVEHPVTEYITGLDLVREQIHIASGFKLELSEGLMAGDRRCISGHSVEARLIAEDPAAGFLPSIGTIRGWAEPKGPGVRFDTGFHFGSEISRHYDSLFAKLITHGPTRDYALDRLKFALLDTHVLGVKSNITYLLEVIEQPEFRAADMDTGSLLRWFPEWQPSAEIPAELASILAAASSISPTRDVRHISDRPSFSLSDGFRIVR